MEAKPFFGIEAPPAAAALQLTDMGTPTLRERVPFRGNLVEADPARAQPPLHAPRHARKPAAERRIRIDDHRKLHENNGIQSETVMYDDSRTLQSGG